MSARPWPAPRRALRRGAVIGGPGARVARLSPDEDRAAREGREPGAPSRERLAALGVLPGAPDVDALARDLVATGLLNWSGPATHVLIASGAGAAMTPETARAAVDFAFSTPRPTLSLEIVDEDGGGWPAGWFAVEYARRKAEWRRRGLAVSWRFQRAPTAEIAAFLAGQRAAAVFECVASGPPPKFVSFPAARARVVVGRTARNAEGWVDVLAGAGITGVQWIPPPEAFSSTPAAARAAAFAGRALARLIERHEDSDLHDERATALLSARPWEVPGLELLETLAYGPDGGVYASEAGWRRAGLADASWRLGRCAELRFSDISELPRARAIVAAAWRPSQPVCADCPYQGLCSVPLTGQRIGGGIWADPWCRMNTALLDAIFEFPDRKKCLKAMEKWGVDFSRIAC